MTKKIIGCDIGGVLRDTITEEVIEGAIESINILSKDYEIVLISKCKDSYKEKSIDWLKKNNLSHLRTCYCETYEEKAAIAKKEKISYMIDDKITVLTNMNELKNVTKIWFCNDDQKINGTKKFNPTVFDNMTLLRTWSDVVNFITQCT